MGDGILILTDVYETLGTPGILFLLLQERDTGLSISHQKMPSYDQHFQFVGSRPYKDWCIVRKFMRPSEYAAVGTVYLTNQYEIGVQIFKTHQRQGYGEWAVRAMMDRHPFVTRFLANINPRNEASLALFRKLGFSDWQVTLAYPGKTHGSELHRAGAGVYTPAHDDEVQETRPG